MSFEQIAFYIFILVMFFCGFVELYQFIKHRRNKNDNKKT